MSFPDSSSTITAHFSVQPLKKKRALLSMLPLDKRAGVQGTALQWKARSAVNSELGRFRTAVTKLPLVKCHRNSRR